MPLSRMKLAMTTVCTGRDARNCSASSVCSSVRACAAEAAPTALSGGGGAAASLFIGVEGGNMMSTPSGGSGQQMPTYIVASCYRQSRQSTPVSTSIDMEGDSSPTSVADCACKVKSLIST